jgi:hypothetical protein
MRIHASVHFMCVVLRLHWCWLGGGVPELDVAVAGYVHEIDDIVIALPYLSGAVLW